MEQTNGNNVVVNGVVLPNHVVMELQRLGRALEWYNSGELHSAVLACAVDRKLIDDPNGVNFMDQLELTDEERRKTEYYNHDGEHYYSEYKRKKEIEEELEREKELERETKNKPNKILSFCKYLRERRAKKLSEEEKLESTY